MQFAIRSFLPRASVTSVAGRHASLGVNAYVQATSPIRRYQDLIAHYQIMRYIRDEPLLGGEEIMNLILESDRKSRDSSHFERETQKYWTTKYMESRVGKTFKSGICEKKTNNSYLVLIEDLGIYAMARLGNSTLGTNSGIGAAAGSRTARRALNVGETCAVEVSAADARQNTLVFIVR